MLHTSSRTAKIAGVAALAGLMMAVAIVAATHQPEPAPPAAGREDVNHDRLARELDRCASLTMPDAGCEAAWAENRRRFFRQSQPALQADAGGGAAPSAGSTAP